MSAQSRDAAIVGIYEYPSRDVEGAVNPLQIKAACAAKALADAGLDWKDVDAIYCLLYTSPSPRDGLLSRMPSSA